ncbi:MAG: cytochrome c oxidase assembly protein [Solirubrobacterales bacterium]
MTAAHMIEHSVIAGVLAPIVVIAWMALGLPRPRVGHPLLAWSAFVVAQWVFHLTPLLEQSQGRPLLHAAEHLAFLGVGVWFWAPVLGSGLGDPGRSLYLVLAAPAVDLVGVALMVRGDGAAGVAMLAGTLPILLAAGLVTWRWLAREHRDTIRVERVHGAAG